MTSSEISLLEGSFLLLEMCSLLGQGLPVRDVGLAGTAVAAWERGFYSCAPGDCGPVGMRARCSLTSLSSFPDFLCIFSYENLYSEMF